MTNLIALYSAQPGCGKSTVAEYLVKKHGFIRLKFAEPLKDMLCIMLRNFLIPHDMIDRYIEGDLKNEIIPEIGVTSRYLQRTLGTEWGREMVRPDLWVKQVQALIGLYPTEKIVLDDMRFLNEHEFVQAHGGMEIRIKRTLPPDSTGAHASEGTLDHVDMYELENDGSKADLYLAVDYLLGY